MGETTGAATGTPRLGLAGVTLLDPEDGSAVETDVLVAEGRVVEIAHGCARGADRVIEARGRTLLPGLIDAHFHAFADGFDLQAIDAIPMSYLAHRAAGRLSRALLRGFTTVRDVAGGDPGLARAVEEGLFPSPHYRYAGPALSQTGGHGDARHATDEGCACGGHMTEVVDGPDELRRATRDRLRRGATVIKIMTSGGVVSPSDPIRVPQYSAEEVRAVVEEADRRGALVAAHAYSPEAIVHSLVNGVRSIEHGNLLDAATADLIRQHDAFLVPTLAAYDAMFRRGAEIGMSEVALRKNLEVRDAGLVALELAERAGVRIGFGSDLMGPLEDEQLAGLRLQAEVLGPLRAIRSATVGNAELLGDPDLARIRPEGPADLLLLPGEVLADPAVLWERRDQPRIVVRDGVAYDGV